MGILILISIHYRYCMRSKYQWKLGRHGLKEPVFNSDVCLCKKNKQNVMFKVK